MSRTLSASTKRRYPLATVRRLWGLSRSTLHRQRAREAANEPRPPRRRGPQGAASDADLLAAIREAIEDSPFTGEASQALAKR